MSKILRRPMFRGGPVDSRGTGITSGLMDNPKRGLVNEPGGYSGELTTGGALVKKNQPSLFGFRFNEPFFSIPTPENRVGGGTGFGFLKPENQFTRDYVEDLLDKEQGKTKDDLGFEIEPPVRYNKGEEKEMKQQDLEVGEGDLNLTEKDKTELDEFYKSIGSKEKVGDYKGGIPDTTKNVVSSKADELSLSNTNNDNQEQVTEIDAKQLMRENAELFKELLGESNKKKIKDARIGDVSDYLLKFFEGSQREGATVGSAAADVAAFATARPSKTEQAKEAIEKQDQTAMALAINDYIAGKRSKEQLDMLSKKLDINLQNKLQAIDYTADVAAASAKGKSMTTLVEESNQDTTFKKIDGAARKYADNRGFNIPRTITSEEIKGDDTTPLVTDTTELLVEENKNQIFIDKSTKEVFQVVEDPNNPGKFLKKRLY